MFHRPVQILAALAAVLALPACQTTTAYEWGTKEDSEWTARAGHTSFDQVIAELGRPIERADQSSGDFKARWPGIAIAVNTQHGTMNDQSISQREDRILWRDMLFDQNGTLRRAWLTTQRDLDASTPP